MAPRFYAQSGRIIMSKPGYNAQPGLPDQFKIFDSDWAFGNVVIVSGSVSVGQGTHTIAFPAQHFIPAIEVLAFDNRNGFPHLIGRVGTTATNSSFTFTAPNDTDFVTYSVYGVTV